MTTSIPIRFSQQQLAVLNNALVNMPYKDAAPLIAHINAEIQRSFDQKQDDDGLSGAHAPKDQAKSE